LFLGIGRSDAFSEKPANQPRREEMTEVRLREATAAEGEIMRQGSLDQIFRISTILDRPYDVVDMIEDVAEAYWEPNLDEGDHPRTFRYSPKAFRVLGGIGWVYALTGWGGDVVYVGRSKIGLISRMKQYMDAPNWGERAYAMELYPDAVVGWNVGDACTRLGQATILALQPPLNVASVTT
jgi:hypothetical protein